MKAKRFIYVVLASIISMSFAGGCSDEDNPPYDPTINDPNYYDTIIYIDERTEDERVYLLGAPGMMTFTEESLDGYRVIYTIKSIFSGESHSCQIYIPAEGADLNLIQDYGYYWFKTSETMVLDDKTSVYFDEKILGEIDEERYYYEKTTDYLKIRFDTPEEINFSIPKNDSGKERKISVQVNNAFTALLSTKMFFIQAGK